MRLLSWNLLRHEGADADAVAEMIRRWSPDLVLMQETDERIDALPTMVGGDYVRRSFPNRRHGLAVWSPIPVAEPQFVWLPGNPARPDDVRYSMVVRVGGLDIACVHLAHGQRVCRRQLVAVATTLGPNAVVMGDYNMFGPSLLPGFSDVGPRTQTHVAWGVLPVRIDRCLVRGVVRTKSTAMPRGASDHRPIMVDLAL